MIKMSCYHPLKGFVIGKTNNNKDRIKVTSYDVDHLERSGPDSEWIQVPDSNVVWPDVVWPAYDIPCGKCIGCRLDYSRAWAARCLLEMKQHESSYFVTLTYDNDHVPLSTGKDPETGELFTTATLVKRDFQLFMKRLRKEYDLKYPNSKIRFFAAGEYGEKYCRPHYHVILFGLKLDDLVFYQKSGDNILYTSKWLQDIWSEPKKKKSDPTIPIGMVVVGEANFETAAYIARYVTKKLNGPAAIVYDDLGIVPEFSLMSRKPGIALKYVEEKGMSLLDDQFIYASSPSGGKKFPIPKYFKRKFDEWFEGDPDLWKMKIKNSAVSDQMLESIKQLQIQQTDLSYLDLLAVQETVKKAKINGLERSIL